MTTNNYHIEKIIDSLANNGQTNFITRQELAAIKHYFHSNEYQIFDLYPESSKLILYKKQLPQIKLFQINSSISLRHQDILGTIYALGIKDDTFGDIIQYQDKYYLFLLPHMTDYFKYNFTTIKNTPITLEEVAITLKENFSQQTSRIEYIVSSLRIDNVVSAITNTSRKDTLDKFKNKEINLNYSSEIKPTRILHEQDIFSIRKYGKYKFNRLLKQTKKGGLVIEILMYK